ncbi:MAG TPA: hypothetical protein VJ981_01775 [Gammaproteobacteria bacterium]|nr:hypothetical protein [Gammaproteobacteria bacterium]
MIRYYKSILLLLCLFLAAGSYADAGTAHNKKTLRIMTVVICQQGGFLSYLLEPYLRDRDITIEYSQGHHSEVARAVQRGEVDIGITHSKVRVMQKLAGEGVLIDGRTVFANPKSFLGPVGDPAQLNGIHDATRAMQRIQEKGYCYVINPHGSMEKLQKDLLDNTGMHDMCVDGTAGNTKMALRKAFEKGAYTLWGLHPFLEKSDLALQPVVVPDRRLLQDLGAWVVKGSAVEPEARELVRYLDSDRARERLQMFRFPGHEDLQPWWPPE